MAYCVPCFEVYRADARLIGTLWAFVTSSQLSERITRVERWNIPEVFKSQFLLLVAVVLAMFGMMATTVSSLEERRHTAANASPVSCRHRFLDRAVPQPLSVPSRRASVVKLPGAIRCLDRYHGSRLCREWLNAMSGVAVRNIAAQGFERIRHDPRIEVLPHAGEFERGSFPAVCRSPRQGLEPDGLP